MNDQQFKKLIETLEKVIPGKTSPCDPIASIESQEITALYFIWGPISVPPTPDPAGFTASTLVIPNNAYTSQAKKGYPIDINSLTPLNFWYPANLLISSYTNFLLDATSPYSRPFSPVVQENGLPITMGDSFAKAMVNKSFKVKSMELIISASFASIYSEVVGNAFPIFPATWNVDKAGPTGNANSFGGVFSQNSQAVQLLGNGISVPFQGVSGLFTECDFIWDCQTTMFINFESGFTPRGPFALRVNVESKTYSTNKIIQNNFNSNQNKP